MKSEIKIIFLFFLLFMGITSVNAISENSSVDFKMDKQLKNELNNENSYQQSGNTHIINTSSFNEYVTNGKLNEKISDGDTIDIQGKLDSPKFTLEINKPVNIISSTGNAYFNSHTSKNGKADYNNYDNIFVVSNGGSGTNITGINFHNTQVRIYNASDVSLNNISLICETNIGNNVGSFNIRGGSVNITVKNSYFMNYANGGHSNVVVAGASNCLIENNTIQCDNTNGLTGNLLYLTTYYSNGISNNNITIRNNLIRTLGPSYPTNYGLTLQGSGHIIEGNVFDNDMPVMAQYADSDYGMETNIDAIIFNNNTIIRGTPQLVFPGIVANNTFNGGALLKQVQVYNNTFNRVTIQNNVKFENNTAKFINITGNNNYLTNNNVYSNEDYAVSINGENNSISNNKLGTNTHLGEESIINTTSYSSDNNTELILPRVFYINDENIDQYFDDLSAIFGYPDYYWNKPYSIKDNVLVDEDILIFNLTDPIELYPVNMDLSKSVKLTIESNENFITFSLKEVTLRNSIVPTIAPQMTGVVYTLINSTMADVSGVISGGTLTTIDSLSLTDFPKDNIYILHSYPDFYQMSDYFMLKNGYLADNVNESSNVLVYNYDSRYKKRFEAMYLSNYYNYFEDIYLDKPLNFIAISNLGVIGSNIHLMDGSSSTNFTGITFDGDLIFNVGYINFFNCTFKKDLIVNDANIKFDGCTFNGKVILNSTINAIFNNCSFNSEDIIDIINSRNALFENNTITTTADNTIIFDNNSSNNFVRNNVLVAGSLVGDDSVVAGDNIVEDNTPSYDTQIIIDAENQAFADDNLEVTIAVNDLNNSMPVSKGYVEVYYDGYLIDIKNLTGGATSVTIPVADYLDGSDSYPIKVWYYEGKRYSNNITIKNIQIVKSNVSISVDEFIAKLNEKATVTATLINQKGNHIRDTNVTVTIGRSSFTVETVDGVATLDKLVTKEWLDAGKLTVVLPATNAYNRNTITIDLNTSKADVLMVPVVSVDGNTADVDLTLSDALGVNVTDGRIVLSTLDGHELASGRVSNGKFSSSVALPDGYSDEYLVANFTGSYYYNDFVRNVKITQMLNSTISLNTNSPLYGEELVITGRLVDSKNTPISSANLTLNLNGSKVIVTTNDDGEYNYTYTPGLGVNSLTVTFDGTVDVYGSSASKDVTIRDTDREMNEVLDRLDELQKENEKLLEQLEQLQEQLEQLREQNNKTIDELNNITQQNNELKEQLDNQTGNLTAQNEALQEQLNNITQQNNATQEQLAALEEQNKELNDKLDNMTKDNEDLKEQLDNQTGNLTAQNEALQYQLDSINEQNEKLNDKLNDLLDLINQLNAPKDTVLTLDALDDAKYGDSITITGSLVDVGGNGVAGTVKLTINGGRATVVSDASGTFTYDYVVTRMGLNNIMATYMGTDKYNPSNASATVNVVEQDTNIVLDNMDAIRSGDNVVVSGQLVDANGKGVYGTIKLTINNGRATVKTDADGFFKYEKALSKVGVNNITAAYVASAKYNACNVTGTVDVTALGTNIVLDDIASVRSGENITISGKLLDENNNAIVGTIKLLINNGRATVKTNNNGEFTYTTTLTKVGSNNITVSYLGANRYTACNTTATVDVSVMDTVLVIDDVADAKKGDIIAVSGKLADANGNAVVGTVKLTINGGRATVKTDNDGVFVYDYTVTKAGLTNVTASYLGANRYGASSATSTVDVAKLATKITINPLESVTQKTSMNITGQLSDENDNGIYGTVKLLINNGRATVKTDKAGLFTYTFTPSKVGENTVTANYLESNNYEATESTAMFTVVKA